MSCGSTGRIKYVYTGNQVGDLNQVGFYNFCSGGAAGSGLSASDTIRVFIPDSTARAPWENPNAQMTDETLDASYPVIQLKWIADIVLGTGVTFRVSNQAFYVKDSNGSSRFYDARAERAPQITVDAGEWLTANYKVSDLSLTLNNRDGFFNEFLTYGTEYESWIGAHVTVKVGFGEEFSNYYTLFEGSVTDKQGVEATRENISIQAFNKLQLNEIPVPPRTFSSDVFPNIDSDNSGKPVSVVYGDWSENVDDWGNVNATVTNSLEVDPSLYNFKVSDAALESILTVYLHRGDRTSSSPRGPIHVTDEAITVDLPNGEFNIDSHTPVLDEPSYIISAGKCAAGTTTGTITSDGTVDFLTLGVKVGDAVINKSDHAASLVKGNLQFISLIAGAGGNAISITLQYGAVGSYLSYLANTQFYAHVAVAVVGTAITLTIPRHLDVHGNTVVTDKASSIKVAIEGNANSKLLVKCKYVGTVPVDPQYNRWTKPSGVRQSTFATSSLSTGQAAEQYSVIRSVANFQLTVDSNITWNPDDEYDLITYQYTWTKGDKVSVVCVGKPLNLMSVYKLGDATTNIGIPTSVAVGLDGTIWVSDDLTQKVYNISYGTSIVASTDPTNPEQVISTARVVRTVDYADIDASITHISGIALSNDNKLWVVDPDGSAVYRYDYIDGGVGLSFTTLQVIGLAAVLPSITGIAVQPNNQVWLVDKNSATFYLIDSAASIPNTAPAVASSFTKAAFDTNAINIQDIGYDPATAQLLVVDNSTFTFYRLNPSDGSEVSSIALADVSTDLTNVVGVCTAQDGTLFFLDSGVLSVYNYNDLSYASVNPAFIARDLLQSYAGHTFSDFDLSWNSTARQLSAFKARVVINKNVTLVSYVSALMRQFNTVFSLRFGRFSLFWITFANFTTTGRLVTEKDIRDSSFTPKKEMNQYFNAANATYAPNAFSNVNVTSDTYVSAAGISFAGREIIKTLDLPAMYRRLDIDDIMPLYVRLAVPDPEFTDVTFGFRMLRAQIHDFINVLFTDDAIDPNTGIVMKSGRRYDNIPCMVRKIQYDLTTMSVTMKLWSLGSTEFTGYVPTGVHVGGQHDKIALSNLGRLGRVSPIGTITSSSTNTLTLANADGQNAQTRAGAGGFAWTPGYSLSLVDGATRAVVQTLTIASVSGATITFNENLAVSVTNTVKNTAGFVVGGHFLQYSNYSNATQQQRSTFASFTKPTGTYPTSASQETQEQRAGLHSFADGGLPYILYPAAYTGF